MAQWSTRINQVLFCCFRCVTNNDVGYLIKLLRFFVLIFAVFLPDFIFLYHNGTVIQVSWKLWMFLICTPHKTRTFTVRLAVTTKYQGWFIPVFADYKNLAVRIWLITNNFSWAVEPKLKWLPTWMMSATCCRLIYLMLQNLHLSVITRSFEITRMIHFK